MMLNEILNTSVDFKIITADENDFRTRAIINGRTITFYARNTGDDVWECRFKEQMPSSGRSTHDVTGSGAEFEVFSMVKDSILELVKRYDPDSFMFTAEKDEESKPVGSRHTRAELYNRLSKRFLIPNYRYVRTGKGSAEEIFSFIKKS